MKAFVNTLFALYSVIRNMFLDTVSDDPKATGMFAAKTFTMSGRTYMMELNVSWHEV